MTVLLTPLVYIQNSWLDWQSWSWQLTHIAWVAVVSLQNLALFIPYDQEVLGQSLSSICFFLSSWRWLGVLNVFLKDAEGDALSIHTKAWTQMGNRGDSCDYKLSFEVASLFSFIWHKDAVLPHVFCKASFHTNVRERLEWDTTASHGDLRSTMSCGGISVRVLSKESPHTWRHLQSISSRNGGNWGCSLGVLMGKNRNLISLAQLGTKMTIWNWAISLTLSNLMWLMIIWLDSRNSHKYLGVISGNGKSVMLIGAAELPVATEVYK